MKKKLSKEFVIGACVIVALCVLFYGIDYLKGINIFKPSNFYLVSYENVAGLEVAAPVSIDGYKVGQVREINFNYENPGKIEVLLALNKDLRVPEDSKAIIASSLLGSSSIELTLGKSKRMIDVGGNIPSGTKSDLMSALSNDIMPSVNSILPKVDSLMTNLNALTRNQALLMSMQRLDGISQNLLYTTAGLNRTVNNDVPVIFNNANRVVYNLDTLTRGLTHFSNTLNELPLQQSMNNVERLTANLESFSAQLNATLNDKNSTVGLLMSDPELYHRLTKMSADIDSLILDIQRNPKRYISIKLL